MIIIFKLIPLILIIIGLNFCSFHFTKKNVNGKVINEGEEGEDFLTKINLKMMRMQNGWLRKIKEKG